MDRQELKERMNKIIATSGGAGYFPTKDITELLNWIDELEVGNSIISKNATENLKATQEKIAKTTNKRINTTGIPDKFKIKGYDLQKWYDRKIVPKGFEKFDEFCSECCDIQTGEYDSSKGSMVDYEITLSMNDYDDVWLGIGGYYNDGCGHAFDEDYIEFKWQG